MQAPPPLRLGQDALFFDVDGTLIEIAGHPDGVVVAPELIEILGRLKDAAGGAVALVSGRPVEQLDELFAPLKLSVAGLHGLDRRNRTTGSSERTAPDRAAYDAAREALLAFVEEDPRLLLEEKGLTLALHFRKVPELESRARAVAEEAVRSSGGAFALLAGKMVLELKPPGADKGDAIGAFMAEEPFRGRRPVFLGDDVTDEAGFSAVVAEGGVAVRVGTDGRDTAARFGLPDVAAVRGWMGGQGTSDVSGRAVA